jgi:hypothetical protein
MYRFRTLALVSRSARKFMRTCCYYCLEEIKIDEVIVTSSGMPFIPHFLKISWVIQKLKGAHI